jgi:hypothetical protein
VAEGIVMLFRKVLGIRERRGMSEFHLDTQFNFSGIEDLVIAKTKNVLYFQRINRKLSILPKMSSH